jgi:hypothetical protein
MAVFCGFNLWVVSGFVLRLVFAFNFPMVIFVLDPSDLACFQARIVTKSCSTCGLRHARCVITQRWKQRRLPKLRVAEKI